MGLALLAISTLAQPLAALHRWWTAGRTLSAPQHQSLALPPENHHGSKPSGHAAPLARTAAHAPITLPSAKRTPGSQICPSRCKTDKPFPLRVLHPHGSGRMAIAGRMADVCAELDRLVASELSH